MTLSVELLLLLVVSFVSAETCVFFACFGEATKQHEEVPAPRAAIEHLAQSNGVLMSSLCRMLL